MPVLLVWSLSALAADEPTFLDTTLDNGLRLSILADDRFPVVSTRVAVHVGSAHEGEGEAGFAHLFEHLFSGGETQRVDESAWWSLHRVAGGYTNATTSYELTTYLSDVPPEAHDEVLGFVEGWFEEMVFDPDTLENEKRIVAEELRLRTENDPFVRAFRAAQRAILAGHPYGHEIAGTHEDIEQATVELCRTFYDRFYTPDRVHVVIVGPVDAPALHAEVQERLGHLPRSTQPLPEVPRFEEWDFPAELVVEEDLPPARTVALVYPTPSPRHPDHWPLVVLKTMLSDGELDRFEEVMVEDQGKALEAGMEAYEFQAGGALLFYSVHLLYRSARRAKVLTRRAVDALDGGPWLDEARLATAKRRLRRRELEARWYPAVLAGRIVRAETQFGDAAVGLDYAAQIEAVSLTDVERVWRTWVVEGDPVEVELRPEKVPVTATLFGWLVPLFGGV